MAGSSRSRKESSKNDFQAKYEFKNKLTQFEVAADGEHCLFATSKNVYVYDMRNMEKKMSTSQKQQTKIKESKVAALEVNKPGFLDVGKVLCHPKEKEFAGVCYDS